MITFYLVRHGEAENNVLSIPNSFPEIKKYSLTEHGKKQAEEAAEFLVTVHADVLFSSPIQRTKETAEIIAKATELEIQFDERLREVGFGIFDGRNIKEFFKKYLTSESRISPDPADEVESFIDMRRRLQNFLEDIKEEYAEKKVIIVSHGDPLEQLHGILTNEAPGVSATGWYPKKGSCTEVVWQGN